MLEWKEAAPLIGVILAGFLGLIGTLIASRKRTGDISSAVSAIPGAVGGALAERGLAENLTLAIGALTTVLTKAIHEMEKDREDEIELRKKQHDALMEEVRRLRLQFEVQNRG